MGSQGEWEQATTNKLYIDALNFGSEFGWTAKKWGAKEPLRRIERFCSAAKRTGLEIAVFLDARALTGEAINKWKSRREKEVKTGGRRVPQGMNVLMGECFARCGVQVCYSQEADNDDTLAAFANLDGANILSRDKDFFRYGPSVTYVLYEDFVVAKDGKLQFRRKKAVKADNRASWRRILSSHPKVAHINPSFITVAEANLFLRGTPTQLCRTYGNPHAAAGWLRGAVYAHLGMTGSVDEEWPEFDAGSGKVRWVRSKNAPSPDADLIARMSADPEGVTRATFSSVDFDGPPPQGVTQVLWHNHLFSLRAVVYELCSVVSNQTMLSIFLSLLENNKGEGAKGARQLDGLQQAAGRSRWNRKKKAQDLQAGRWDQEGEEGSSSRGGKGSSAHVGRGNDGAFPKGNKKRSGGPKGKTTSDGPAGGQPPNTSEQQSRGPQGQGRHRSRKPKQDAGPGSK